MKTAGEKTRVTVVAVLVCAAACDHRGGGPAAGDGDRGARPQLGMGQGADRVLAVVGDGVITVGDFLARLNRQSPYIRARYRSAEKRKAFLERMIRFELQAQEAVRRGLDDHPQVVRTAKQVMIQKLRKTAFADQEELEDVSGAEIEEHYRQHEGYYHRPEMVRAQHILFAVDDPDDPLAVTAARTMARRVRRELRRALDDPDAFAGLAREHSDDARTRARGGDLGFFRRVADGGTHDPAVTAAAFALREAGDVSGIVQGKHGLHLIQLTTRRAAIDRSLDEVRSGIRRTILRKRRRQAAKDFVAALRAKADIQVDEDAVSALEIETEAPSGTSGPAPTRSAGGQES